MNVEITCNRAVGSLKTNRSACLSFVFRSCFFFLFEEEKSETMLDTFEENLAMDKTSLMIFFLAMALITIV